MPIRELQKLECIETLMAFLHFIKAKGYVKQNQGGILSWNNIKFEFEYSESDRDV